MELVKSVYDFLPALPAEEKYGLRSQVSRAAVSIPSNIAEGCSRSSDIEFKRFLEISMGSTFELETQLIIISNIQPAIKGETERIIEQLRGLQKQINALISKLKANS